MDISGIIHLTATAHCFFFKLKKCCHLSETQIHKKIDRTGKKCIYYRNTNKKPYQVSFRVKTCHLLQRYHGYLTNLAFVRPVFEGLRNMFQRSCWFTALTRGIFSTLDENFRISTRLCNALCIYIVFYQSH